MRFSLEDYRLFHERLNANEFLIGCLNSGRLKFSSSKDDVSSSVYLVFPEHPNINFKLEEVVGITSENKLQAFFESKERLKELQAKSPAAPKKYEESEVPSMVQHIMDTKEETRDMMVGTGYTQVISDKPIIAEENLDMVQSAVNTTSQTKEVVKDASKHITTEEPTIVKHAIEMNNQESLSKTKTLAPKEDKQSGFSDAVIIGVVVLVYVAIIVNLILRLK